MAQSSSTAEILLTIVPIVGIVIGGVVIFFYLLWRHREISLQIRTGVYKPHKMDIRLFAFFTGILLTGIGLVLSIFFVCMNGLSYQLLGGLIPLALGICLLIVYTKYPTKTEDNATK